MHNFVYLAQRRSQEFSCEPNFGVGRASPLGCASGRTTFLLLCFWGLCSTGDAAIARIRVLLKFHQGFMLPSWPAAL